MENQGTKKGDIDYQYICWQRKLNMDFQFFGLLSCKMEEKREVEYFSRICATSRN